ncbi:exocyst complex component EXO70B1-like [Panicum miliaceum]|uniref:Exocyst complex component EXO70B1-like n=1 Tax=Panicum miliaceum TaxID=4540 RepID=A0A3L6SQC6_PANMI|nr:exocyst complex component EXO70B1-like [Panicum miliaceum]
MICILSGFDNRLSSITNDHLFPSPDPSSGSGSTSALGSSASEISCAAAFDAADQLIQLWDATPEALVFEAPEDDVAPYLAAVAVAVEHLSRGGPSGTRAGVAMQLAMARLEEELRHLMVRHAAPIDPTGLFFSLHRLSLESLDDLDTSSEFDAATLHSLDGIPAGIDEVQRIEWKLLNDKMKKWVHGVKTVVRVLLAGERRLCDQVLATPKLFQLIMSDDPRVFLRFVACSSLYAESFLLHHIRIYDSEYPNSLNPQDDCLFFPFCQSQHYKEKV